MVCLWGSTPGRVGMKRVIYGSKYIKLIILVTKVYLTGQCNLKRNKNISHIGQIQHEYSSSIKHLCQTNPQVLHDY